MSKIDYCFLMLLTLIINIPALANGLNGDNDKPQKVVIEFQDKFNEITLGLTTTSVYLKFDETIRTYINKELTAQYNLEANQFLDSEGEFVPGSFFLLDENVIEYALKDIEDIQFYKGKLIFKYLYRKDFTFDDILNSNGSQALKNFYIEDLEMFYLNYINMIS